MNTDAMMVDNDEMENHNPSQQRVLMDGLAYIDPYYNQEKVKRSVHKLIDAGKPVLIYLSCFMYLY